MFAKSFAAAVILAFTLQANAHCAIEPPLGVAGTPARSDVQRPSKAAPCGTINVAAAVPTSSAVALTNGAFTMTALNFNTGVDGSRQVTGTVDPTASGKSFAGAVTITTNGDLNPTNVGPQPIVGTLPAGTTCTGGADKASCLVSFTTAGGFGNCVLVSQGAAGAAANTTAATPPAAAGNATTAATPAAGAPKKAKGAKGAAKAKGAKKAAGTRRARALLASLEARGEETVELARRGIASWIWAA